MEQQLWFKKKTKEGELSRALGFPTKEMGPVGFSQPWRGWRFPLGMCVDHCWWHTDQCSLPTRSSRLELQPSVWSLWYRLVPSAPPPCSFFPGAGALCAWACCTPALHSQCLTEARWWCSAQIKPSTFNEELRTETHVLALQRQGLCTKTN